MVVLSIITLLLTVAVPAYDRQLLKARSDEAKLSIQMIAFAQERLFQETGRYFPADNTTTVNGEDISSNLRIDLTKSNNFNYKIISTNSGANYEVHAFLRIKNNDDCDSSSICTQEGTANMDTWINNYTRGENKHLLRFTFPTLLVGDNVESDISFADLFTGD